MKTETQWLDTLDAFRMQRDTAERELAEAIAQAYQDGVPSKRIARVLGVSDSRVRQIAGPRLHLESLGVSDE